MCIEKFDFDHIGWNGSLQSILGLFSDLINYQLNPSYKKTDEFIQFENYLKGSDILSKWQETKQNNSEVPVFKSFQKKYRTFNDYDFTALDMEIQEKGLLLAQGQILFRGVCSDNQNDDWSQPVSTTLSPYIAIYHALKNGHMKPIKIYIIEIPADFSIKAIIGPFGDNDKFGQEYEVLANFKYPPKVNEEIIKHNVTFQLLRW